MANTYQITPGSGDSISGVELGGAFTTYASTGKLPGSVLYVGPSSGSAPAPLSNANPMPVHVTDATLAVTQSGTWSVVSAGSVASGATDSGNPVKVGGVYHSAPVTLTDGQRGDLQLDANGYLKVNLVTGGGGGSNAAASATGSAVPASADYAGLNVSGTLRGRTGVNPTGSVYAAQTDLSSVGGTSFALGQQLAAASMPVVLTAAQVTTLTPPAAITGFALDATLSTLSGKVTACNTGAVVLAAGSAVVGHVIVDTAPTTAVTGTFWQATQPVSIATLPALAAGSAVIGHVIVDSGTVTTVSAVTAITNALPAGTNLLGAVIAPNQTGAVYSGTTAQTPQTAFVNATAAGNTPLVAAVSAKKIYVLKLTIFPVSGTVNVKFQSATTDITPLAYLTANQGFGLAYSDQPHFQSINANEALNVNLSTTGNVGVLVTYLQY